MKPTEGAKEVKNVSEESGVTLSSLSEGKMADIRNEVKQMIKEGKSDAECLSRIKTLKDILTMLDATSIHKLDEVSNVKESECPKEDNKVKNVEGSDNVTETTQNVIIKVKICGNGKQ